MEMGAQKGCSKPGEVEAVIREIRKLENSVSELTEAVKALTASLKAAKSPASQFSQLNNFHLSEGPKSVCRDANCGVINSDATLCDHTIARYRSEYDCG